MSTATVTNGLRTAVFGEADPRIRATWRFLLAWPLLPLINVFLALAMPLLGVAGMIPGGPLQGIALLVILLVWARVVDRRPLSNYGVSASWSWLGTLLVGFVAVVAVWSGWHALAASLGWMEIEPSMTAPQDSVLFGLGGVLVSLVINTLVQDVVFFAIVLKSAAEGFRSRGVEPTRAVLGGWLVGIVFFTVIHGMPGPLDVLAHAVGAGIFGLLYVHTGDLALTVGVHWGSSYAAGTIFATSEMARQGPSWFEVTEGLPQAKGWVAAIVLYLVTYLVLLGWIRWRRGEVPIETDLARWTERGEGLLGLERNPQDV